MPMSKRVLRLLRELLDISMCRQIYKYNTQAQGFFSIEVKKYVFVISDIFMFTASLYNWVKSFKNAHL
jgi:hypothetical protein